MAKIGELIINLKANTAAFASDLKHARDLSFSSSKHIAQSLSLIGSAAAGMTVAAGAALAYLTKQSIDQADRFCELSKITGLTTETLSWLSHAADMSGTNVEDLATATGKMSRNMYAAAEGTKEQKRAFAALGVDVTDAQGKLRSTEAVLLDLADAFAGMPEGPRRTALAIQVLGKSGASLLPLLSEGKAGLLAFKEEAKRFGLIVSTETAVQADAFNDNLGRLQKSIKGIGIAVMVDALPTLTALTDHLVEVAKESDSAKQSIARFAADSVINVIAVGIATGRELEDLGARIKNTAAWWRLFVAGDQAGLAELEANAARESRKILQQRLDDFGEFWDKAHGINLAGAAKAGAAKAGPGGGVEDEALGKAAAKAAKEHIKALEDQARSFNAIYQELTFSLDGVSAAQQRYLKTQEQIVAIGDAEMRGILDTINARLLLKETTAPLIEKTREIEVAWRLENEAMIQAGVTLSEMPPMNAALAESFGALGESVNTSMSLGREAMLAFRDAGREAFEMMSAAMGQAIAQAVVYSKSIGEAMRSAMKASLAAIAGEAIVKAIQSTALGFYLLAVQDYRGAALAFKSAAIYGAIGGVAAGIGRAIPGGEGGGVGTASPYGLAGPGGASSGVVVGPVPMAPGAAPAPGGGVTVVVNIQGSVYGGQAGLDELTQHISQAVERRDVQLIATRAKLPAYAGS